MKPIKILAAAIFLIQFGLSIFGQTTQSTSFESAIKARETLNAAIEALGGRANLREVKDITRELSGVRTDVGQGLRPVTFQPNYEKTLDAPVTNHPKIISIRDFANQRASDYLEDVIIGGQSVKWRTVIDSKNAFTAFYTTQIARMQPAASLPFVRASTYRRYPESLLLIAANRPTALRWLGEANYDGRRQNVIVFADSDGTQISMYFDAATNLLTKTETAGDNAMMGDVANEVVYGDYRPVGKLTLPFRYTDKTGGVMLQNLTATSIKINAAPAEAAFAIPEGFTREESAPPPATKKLAEDVYAVLGSYNSLFVVFNDYVLVVEAGQSSGYGQNIIRQVKTVAPNKPIRYLISTHFHFDHLSGVRSFIAEGSTIVTTSDAKGIIAEMAGKPHILFPDALATAPKSAVIETVADKRVFEDDKHKVEIYSIGPNPHCEQMLIIYLPNEKILFEADMLDLDLPDGGTPLKGADTVDLANKIQRLGLQVEKILPVHGRMGTMADLQKALSVQ